MARDLHVVFDVVAPVAFSEQVSAALKSLPASPPSVATEPGGAKLPRDAGQVALAPSGSELLSSPSCYGLSRPISERGNPRILREARAC